MLALTHSLVMAQPQGAEKELFTYRIQPNDTLIKLAENYTLDAGNWQVLQELNHIEDPYKLPIGKIISIPFSLIPVRASTGVLVHRQGQVLINGVTAATEDTVQSGDTLSTGANSYATIELEDESTISIPAQSSLLFKQINQFVGVPLSDVIFELNDGALETQAAPDGRGVGRYEVHTPVSITGVRGTKIRVSSSRTQSRTELVQGQAHIEAEAIQPRMLQARQGAALDEQGRLLVVDLPAAPQIRTAQAVSGGLQVALEPDAQARYYHVQIASDPKGQHIIDHQQFDESEFSLSAVQAGTHYAFIRAVDEQGFMGLDTMIDFPGRRVLRSGNGQPVRTAFGLVVFSGAF